MRRDFLHGSQGKIKCPEASDQKISDMAGKSNKKRLESVH